jgi:hypothetical protein
MHQLFLYFKISMVRSPGKFCTLSSLTIKLKKKVGGGGLNEIHSQDRIRKHVSTHLLFRMACAIPPLPGSHTEGPQPTGIVLTPCTTLPKYWLSPCQAGIGMRTVHSVGRAATTHEFLLLSTLHACKN